MVGALMIARVARTMDRVAGVGLGPEVAVLDLEVVSDVAYVDITVDHQAFGEILQPRHAEPEVPLGVGDRQLHTSFLLAIFRNIFPREGTAVLAAIGAEEIEGSAPP